MDYQILKILEDFQQDDTDEQNEDEGVESLGANQSEDDQNTNEKEALKDDTIPINDAEVGCQTEEKMASSRGVEVSNAVRYY